MTGVFDDKAEKQILDDYRELAHCLTTLGLTARRSQQFHPSFTISYSFPVTFSHTVYPLLGSAQLMHEIMQLLNICTRLEFCDHSSLWSFPSWPAAYDLTSQKINSIRLCRR